MYYPRWGWCSAVYPGGATPRTYSQSHSCWSVFTLVTEYFECIHCVQQDRVSQEGVVATCGFLFWCSSCGNSTPDLLWAKFVSPVGCSQAGQAVHQDTWGSSIQGLTTWAPSVLQPLPILSTLNLVFQPNFLFPEIPHKLRMKSIPL